MGSLEFRRSDARCSAPSGQSIPKRRLRLADLFLLLASAKQGLGLRDSKIFGGDSGAVQGRLEFPAPSLTKPEPAEFVVVAESDVWQLITKARRASNCQLSKPEGRHPTFQQHEEFVM